MASEHGGPKRVFSSSTYGFTWREGLPSSFISMVLLKHGFTDEE